MNNMTLNLVLHFYIRKEASCVRNLSLCVANDDGFHGFLGSSRKNLFKDFDSFRVNLFVWLESFLDDRSTVHTVETFGRTLFQYIQRQYRVKPEESRIAKNHSTLSQKTKLIQLNWKISSEKVPYHIFYLHGIQLCAKSALFDHSTNAHFP